MSTDQENTAQKNVVVLGSSPSTCRAAALAETLGYSVQLLLTQPVSKLPEGRGAWVGDGGEPARRLYGNIQSFSAEKAVFLGKNRITLPTSPAQLARILPTGSHRQSVRDWVRARATIELAELVGGGQEQRTFQHWITRRYGRSIYQTLFASYCQRRFGPPEEVSANIARYIQAPQSSTLYAPAAPLDPSSLKNVQVLENIHVEKIASGTVYTNLGTFSGKLLTDLPPIELARLLTPDIEPGVLQDTQTLGARHRVTVYLHGNSDLPFETHILDDSVRFYRITRPDLLPHPSVPHPLAIHYALDTQAANLPDSTLIDETIAGLSRLGITATADNAILHREVSTQPLWTGVHLSRLRRWSIALEAWKIIPIGRTGLHSYQDPSEELAYLQAALAPNQTKPLRSLIRDFVEPSLQEPNSHLRRMIER